MTTENATPPLFVKTEKYSSDPQVLIEELKARDEHLLDLLNDYQERSQQLVHAYQALARQNKEILELKELEKVYQSTSWRITAPMRAVSQAVQDLRHSIGVFRQGMRAGHGFGRSLGDARRAGSRHQPAAPQEGPETSSLEQRNYQTWVRLYDTPDEKAIETMRGQVAAMPRRPLVSVVMPTWNANLVWLEEAIVSVQKQVYGDWELCIADDASTNAEVRPFLEQQAAKDPRIKVVFRPVNGHISAATNSALEVATGEWITFLDHDDLLPPQALYYMVKAAIENPRARMIYSDEDKVDEQGRRHDPYFKSDWNPDLFYAHNLVTHLAFYHREVMDQVGGLRDAYAGAQDYDLVLRVIEKISADQIVHVPFLLYHWRAHAASTAKADLTIKPYAMLAGERALNDHFRRIGNGARAQFVGHGFRARFRLPDEPPMASIIIPTRNALKLVEVCIKSIRDMTRYRNYEVILVDNGSDDPAALAYFAEINKLDNIRVIRDEQPFCYSAINNRAAEQAKGEILVFLNNDIEVINPEWLDELISHACRPGIGAVGARLIYPNGTIQHAGIVLGIGGWAGHAHKSFSSLAHGYVGRLTLQNNFSAVTGACLAVQKKYFLQVGGFDEVNLRVACNDVDLCLKFTELGLRNLYTPFASLYHHESATRGFEDTPEKKARFAKEVAYMWKRWPKLMANDPYYSPNLTLDAEDFGIAWPPRTRHAWVTDDASSAA